MRRAVLCLCLCPGLIALAACTPYDPSLPPTPFLCGDQEPRCPEGYTCVTDRNDRMVCLVDNLAHDAGVPDAAVAGKVTEMITETSIETSIDTITDPARSR
jgi:hypothetical protein